MTHTPDHDVIIIGGSYAGSAAALQLLRAHRRVLVIDAGQRRNDTVPKSHGFITQDGRDPADLARAARRDLEAYPTLTWADGAATTARADAQGFVVTYGDGKSATAARLILATGVRDTLPEIAGLAERWGDSVAACPYCHGYECAKGAIAVIGTGPESLHQAQLLSEWGQVDFLTQGIVPLDKAAQDDLSARGVTIMEAPVHEISGRATIRLADDTTRDYAGIFTATRIQPATDIAAQLGCEMEETAMGTTVVANAMQATSVDGVFACGDLATPMASVSNAVGKGTIAGVATHQSLVFPS